MTTVVVDSLRRFGRGEFASLLPHVIGSLKNAPYTRRSSRIVAEKELDSRSFLLVAMIVNIAEFLGENG